MTEMAASAATSVPRALQELVEFEQREVHDVQVTARDHLAIHFDPDAHLLQFTYAGVSYMAPIDKKLVHQLGSRIWPGEQDYGAIKALWQQLTCSGELEAHVRRSLVENELVIRYYTVDGENWVYGIVSSHFVHDNQLEFRKSFLEVARQGGVIGMPRPEALRGSSGRVVETFDFNAGEYQTRLALSLIYGLNNGYGSYSVQWERTILVCTNGLTRHELLKSLQWKHTHQVKVEEFINNAVKEGVDHHIFLEQRIARANSAELESRWLDELLARICLAHNTKIRLLDRVQEERKANGSNEWALVQALTWLGTHEQALQPGPKRLLREAGTRILEQSLPQYLRNETSVYIGQDGYYGPLLPRDFPHVVRGG